MDIKTKLYVTHTKVFDNDLIAICKSKVTQQLTNQETLECVFGFEQSIDV